MTRHKFCIGQQVTYRPGKRSLPASSLHYRIVRQMPLESGEFSYRIKSDGDSFERVVREGEISSMGDL